MERGGKGGGWRGERVEGGGWRGDIYIFTGYNITIYSHFIERCLWRVHIFKAKGRETETGSE